MINQARLSFASRLIIIVEIKINNGNALYKYLISSDGDLLSYVL